MLTSWFYVFISNVKGSRPKINTYKETTAHHAHIPNSITTSYRPSSGNLRTQNILLDFKHLPKTPLSLLENFAKILLFLVVFSHISAVDCD